MSDSIDSQGTYEVGSRLFYHRKDDTLFRVEILSNDTNGRGINYDLKVLEVIKSADKDAKPGQVVTCSKPKDAGDVASWQLLNEEELSGLEASLGS